MAKNMVRIENDMIINIEWWADEKSETEFLKNCAGYSLAIGDVFKDGKFYRNGEEVLPDLEVARKEIETLKAKILSLQMP